MRSAAVFFTAVALGVSNLYGQAVAPGRVRGLVLDASGSPIPMSQVYVSGTRYQASADLKGRYELTLPPGSYAISARLIGYRGKTVTGVIVTSGTLTELNITLEAAAYTLEAVQVTAEVERGSTVALLEQRRTAAVVTDAVGAQEIARTPDGDAAQVLRRVTGLTVVNDRYVYVRGLGERYSTAQLNGAPLPSTEPDRKAIPLDIFPSAVLEEVVTSKTYTPDQPGDYAGGMVDIRTKELPGFRQFRLSYSAGYNGLTTFQRGLGYPGGDLDFLGIPSSARRLPAEIPSDVKVVDSELSTDQLTAIGRAFVPVWEPQSRTVPMNQSMAVSYADETRILGATTGLVLSGTYANTYKSQQLVERIIVTADQAEEPETDYAGRRTERAVRWSFLGRLNVVPSASSEVTLRTLYSRGASDESRLLTGFNRDRNNNLENFRLRFNSRAVWSNQLAGEHYRQGLLGGLRATWQLGYATGTTDEPDRREVVYDQTADGRYAWRELTNSGTRYFTALRDRDRSAGLDLRVPLGATAASGIKVGARWLDKAQDMSTRRFRFRARSSLGELAYLPPDSLFSAEHIRPDLLQIQEDTRRTDNYHASQVTGAAYAMLDLAVASGLRLTGGVRLERVNQKVVPYDLFPLGLPPVDSAVLDDADWLPGINATWSPAETHNLRLAFSQTVARPEFREQAPFDFVDYAGGFLQVGNPSLKRTQIRNYDVRWEWFPGLGDLVAVSGFYKSFRHPIEAVVFPSSELIATWDNNDAATVYGAELEVRTDFGFLTEGLQSLTISSNLALIHSSVQTGDSLRLPNGAAVAVEPRTRPLQGQSPYTVNLSLSYVHPGAGFTITGLYNRFGPRIDKVGTQVLPDVFEEPRDQLDLVVEQPLGRRANAKVTASNLLDEPAVFTQAGQLVRRWSIGRTFTVGISIGS